MGHIKSVKLWYILGNLILLAPFVKELLWPTDALFIYQAGPALLLVEFLSIHSSVFAAGTSSSPRIHKKIFLVLLYTVVVAFISLSMKNPFLLVFFFASLAVKFFSKGPKDTIGREAMVSVVSLFLATGVAVVLSTTVAKYFPLPPEILSAKPVTHTISPEPLLNAIPQAMLVWAISYFLFVITIRLALSKKWFNGE